MLAFFKSEITIFCHICIATSISPKVLLIRLEIKLDVLVTTFTHILYMWRTYDSENKWRLFSVNGINRLAGYWRRIWLSAILFRWYSGFRWVREVTFFVALYVPMKTPVLCLTLLATLSVLHPANFTNYYDCTMISRALFLDFVQ